MNDFPPSRKGFPGKWVSITEVGLLAIIVTVLLLKLRLIFLLNINGDEFTFLSAVHDYLRGRLASPFFSFHVHFFSWLPLVSDDELSQIIAGRGIMYALGIGSAIFTYLTGRFFFNRAGALFSVLCYLSISNMIVHGTSFRFDPIASFLFLVSVYLLIKPSESGYGVLFSGFCMALSLMITGKTVFHLATIGGIFIVLGAFSGGKGKVSRKAGLFGVAVATVFILLYRFHVSALGNARLPQAGTLIRNLASTDILFGDFFPNWQYTWIMMLENPMIWALWFAGIFLRISDSAGMKGKRSPQSWILFSFLLSFLPLIFYKFVHPYFFVFLLSPAILFCGVVVDRILDRSVEKESALLYAFVPLISLAVFFHFFLFYKKNSFDQTIGQKELIRMVHRIFPSPVPYIDRCSMISSFPKVGMKMSSWDMERYTRANVPIMRNLLIDHHPVFVLANIVFLDLDSPPGGKDIFRNYPLLEEDFQTLKTNFIRHWGKLYVAGKHLRFDSRDRSYTFDVLIPGAYTVEAREGISIDGRKYRPGSIVELARKRHAIVPETVPSEVILRWGEHLYRPPDPPSSQPVFFGYYWTADSVKPEGAGRD